ncbi:MAG: DUF190 domain-containing protein [bacterium]
MASSPKMKALRIYLDEKWKCKNQPLYREIVERLRQEKIAGATVFRAVEGFGSSFKIHEAHILTMSENLPLVVEVIDRAPQVKRAWDLLQPILPEHCLATVQEIQVLRCSSSQKR